MATNKKTQLEIIAEQQRNQLMPKNYYNMVDPYSSSHKHALSDGDEHGKGDYNNSVGGKTDIIVRIDNLKSNKHNPKNPYPDFTVE
jgi:hypothetical protein